MLRFIFSHSQQITTAILSLCFFLSHKQHFLIPVTPLSCSPLSNRVCPDFGYSIPSLSAIPLLPTSLPQLSTRFLYLFLSLYCIQTGRNCWCSWACTAALGSLLPACRGTRGSIAVPQLLFPLQNVQPEQRKSLVMRLKVDEKMGEHIAQCLRKTVKNSSSCSWIFLLNLIKFWNSCPTAEFLIWHCHNFCPFDSCGTPSPKGRSSHLQCCSGSNFAPRIWKQLMSFIPDILVSHQDQTWLKTASKDNIWYYSLLKFVCFESDMTNKCISLMKLFSLTFLSRTIETEDLFLWMFWCGLLGTE